MVTSSVVVAIPYRVFITLLLLKQNTFFFCNVMGPKNRQVDNKDGKFMTEWTERYCFTLPDEPGAVSFRLICNKTVAFVKIYKLKRLYEITRQQLLKQYLLIVKQGMDTSRHIELLSKKARPILFAV